MADDTELARRFRGLRRSIFGKGDTNLPLEEGSPAMKRKKSQESAQRTAVGHLRNLTKGKAPFSTGGKK